MMNTSDPDPWSELKVTPLTWVGRRHSATHPLSPYWAVHPNGAPGLVIRGLDSEIVPKEIPRLKGLTLEVSEDSESASIRLFLQKSYDRDTFRTLCEDIIMFSGTFETAREATEAVFVRISRWQSLLGFASGGELSEHEVRGILGELWFLIEVLAPKIGIGAALKAWVAPEGHPQDFALDHGVVELKTRLSAARRQITITSLDQLERGHLPLYLVVIELTPASSSEIGILSLNDVVADLIAQAAIIGVDTAESARCAIAERGYAPSPSYDLWCYRVSGNDAFRVVEGFPALQRTAVDPQILSAEYTLSLGYLGDYSSSLADAVRSCIQPKSPDPEGTHG